MTKMTDAFKKIFLDLGGNPKELAENTDVGDYILDLESAIKAYVNEAASGDAKVIVIEADENATEISSIHLWGSDIDITTNDLHNYINEGYKIVLHQPRPSFAENVNCYADALNIADDPTEDQDITFTFKTSTNQNVAIYVGYSGSRTIFILNQNTNA